MRDAASQGAWLISTMLGAAVVPLSLPLVVIMLDLLYIAPLVTLAQGTQIAGD